MKVDPEDAKLRDLRSKALKEKVVSKMYFICQ